MLYAACANCGTDFLPRDRLHLCCSRKCSNRYNYQQHRQERIAYAMAYLDKNRAQIRKSQTARVKSRRESDPEFRASEVKRLRKYRARKAAERRAAGQTAPEEKGL